MFKLSGGAARNPDPETRRRDGISVVERIVVLSVVGAALVFEYWFFFLAGSPLGNP